VASSADHEHEIHRTARIAPRNEAAGGAWVAGNMAGEIEMIDARFVDVLFSTSARREYRGRRLPTLQLGRVNVSVRALCRFVGEA